MVRVFAQGLANAEHVGKAFEGYVNAVYPFAVDEKSSSDKKLLEAVEREVSKGPITFSPIESNALKNSVKNYTMSDEAVQKLRSATTKRRGLK